jgi:hypothetical protein
MNDMTDDELKAAILFEALTFQDRDSPETRVPVASSGVRADGHRGRVERLHITSSCGRSPLS